jgi:hypothetical protein
MLPVRIFHLVTGQQVIAGHAELFDEENQKGTGFPPGLLMKCPYVLSMTPYGDVSPDGSPSQFNVNFTKWMPYSSDDQFKIPIYQVIALGEPEQNILDIYIEKFGDRLDDIKLAGQSDSSDSSEGSGLSDSGDRGEGGES